MNLNFATMNIFPAFLCLRKWVLAWFFMALGAAVASPLAHPKTIEIICTGSGTTHMVVHTEAGVVDGKAHVLDCPLCLVSGAPPAAPSLAPVFAPTPSAPVIRSSSPFIAATAAPAPARGPPVFLSHS